MTTAIDTGIRLPATSDFGSGEPPIDTPKVAGGQEFGDWENSFIVVVPAAFGAQDTEITIQLVESGRSLDGNAFFVDTKRSGNTEYETTAAITVFNPEGVKPLVNFLVGIFGSNDPVKITEILTKDCETTLKITWNVASYDELEDTNRDNTLTNSLRKIRVFSGDGLGEFPGLAEPRQIVYGNFVTKLPATAARGARVDQDTGYSSDAANGDNGSAQSLVGATELNKSVGDLVAGVYYSGGFLVSADGERSPNKKERLARVIALNLTDLEPRDLNTQSFMSKITEILEMLNVKEMRGLNPVVLESDTRFLSNLSFLIDSAKYSQQNIFGRIISNIRNLFGI